MQVHTNAYVCIIYEKTWSELGKQNIQAERSISFWYFTGVSIKLIITNKAFITLDPIVITDSI